MYLKSQKNGARIIYVLRQAAAPRAVYGNIHSGDRVPRGGEGGVYYVYMLTFFLCVFNLHCVYIFLLAYVFLTLVCIISPP